MTVNSPDLSLLHSEKATEEDSEFVEQFENVRFMYLIIRIWSVEHISSSTFPIVTTTAAAAAADGEGKKRESEEVQSGIRDIYKGSALLSIRRRVKTTTSVRFSITR